MSRCQLHQGKHADRQKTLLTHRAASDESLSSVYLRLRVSVFLVAQSDIANDGVDGIDNGLHARQVAVQPSRTSMADQVGYNQAIACIEEGGRVF